MYKQSEIRFVALPRSFRLEARVAAWSGQVSFRPTVFATEEPGTWICLVPGRLRRFTSLLPTESGDTVWVADWGR